MKKYVLGVALIVSIMLSAFFQKSATFASCPPTFYIGTEIVNGCSGLTNDQQIPGFSIDVDNNKITLNNYNGGGIYYSCHASCSTFKSMEIELIGENVIDSTLSSEYQRENGFPDITDAGFINIVPTFTGTGTLTIKSSIPLTFENRVDESSTIEIVGQNHALTQNTSDAESQGTISELARDKRIADSDLDSSHNEVTQGTAPSFFDTTAGLVLLIAVPSILVMIIIVLIIMLMKKNPTGNNPANDIDENQQLQQDGPGSYI